MFSEHLSSPHEVLTTLARPIAPLNPRRASLILSQRYHSVTQAPSIDTSIVFFPPGDFHSSPSTCAFEGTHPIILILNITPCGSLLLQNHDHSLISGACKGKEKKVRNLKSPFLIASGFEA